MHVPRRARGLSLIELLMFIVVVGIALAAMLRVFTTATLASADPMIRRQQLAIAESLLREATLMPFTWCQPGTTGEDTATSAGGCAQPESMGPEAGQARGGPNPFDNVNDYDGLAINGITDINNQAVAGLGGYSATVTVAAAALDSIPADGSALRVTVTVTAPSGGTLSLQGWRTRYAPNAMD